ncbi:hypothetical protein [Owenweeksia hongkongensis]|uniref:hypothetical protein n=1 Tax=Owenweeksia hongkongensis TaxID=253245 RepID=UPI003A8EE3C6
MQKPLFKTVFFTFCIALFSLLSCSDDKEDDNPSGEENAAQSIQNNIQEGTWKVSRFIDSGDDETSDYDGYNFTFGPDGVLTATNGTQSYSGDWSITFSSNNDDSPYELDFNIIFNLANDFEDLDDDWDINAYSTTKLELFDASGGSGDTDYLTFEKN